MYSMNNLFCNHLFCQQTYCVFLTLTSWGLYANGRTDSCLKYSTYNTNSCSNGCLPHTVKQMSFLLQNIHCRAPSVSCATRLKLSVCLFIFSPGISSQPLNLSQQKFARWRQVVRNRTWRVSFFEFLRGVRLGAKNVTFCPDLPGVTFTKYNMAPKRRTISKIENCLVLAR